MVVCADILVHVMWALTVPKKIQRFLLVLFLGEKATELRPRYHGARELWSGSLQQLLKAGEAS